jgi:photosystem II stability/assembly factor-like uncharacterized protein
MPRLFVLVAALLLPAVAPAQRRTTPATPAAAASAPTVAADSLAMSAMRVRMLGPFRGGRSTAVAGVVSETNTFYMGTTGGGVWRTDDAGHTWQNISDKFFGGSIGSVAVAPSDPNVIYVGEGSADIRGNSSQGRGAWRSTDAGRTWSRMPLVESGQIGRIVVHPSNASLAYAAVLGRPFGRNAERGIYRTRDGGTSWQKVLFLNDSTGASDIAMNPRNPRILYAAMWRAERKPWTMISGSPEGGIWRSADGGDTWTKLGGGLPTGAVGKIGLSVSPANPDRVWAIIEAEPAGGVYRSDDGGETWTRTNSENGLRQRAWYYTHIRADPAEENVVYVLNTSLLRSIDGGRTFTNVSVPHGDVHDLWINPSNKAAMVVADDGGAQVSVNRGRTWSTYWNQPTSEFYDVITDNAFPYRAYTAQQDNTTISVPAWSSPHSLHPISDYAYAAGCETGPVALDRANPRVIWGGCYGGAINRWDTVTDERRNVIAYPQLQLGQAANELKHRFQWVAPILVSQHDANTVYHASQVVLRTRDGGMKWEQISPDLTTNTAAHQVHSGGPINRDITGVEMYNTVFALAEDPRDARSLWAGSDDGRVHVTRDAGATWTDVTPPGMPRFGTVEEIVVSRHAPQRVYVAVQAFRLDDFRPYVFRSDDGGKSWRRLTNATDGIPADHPVRSFAEDARVPDLLYAGTEYGLFVSLDGGARWQKFPGRLPVTPIADIDAREDDLVMATQGRSLWIIDDLSALRDVSAFAATPARLVPPLDAVRAQRGVDPFDPVPQMADQPDDGAALHYWLGAAADSTLSLEIRDARGTVVRRFTPDSARSRLMQQPRLATGRGLHRLVWDLKYPGPSRVDGVVVWGYTDGVKAPPGDYTVELRAGAVTERRTLRVLPDPRLPNVTAAQYAEQFRTAMAVRDSMESLNRVLRDLRDVRAQQVRIRTAADAVGAATEVWPLSDTLKLKLDRLEQRLTQPASKSGQDPIRHAGMLDNQWVELYGNLTGADGYISGGADGAPTAGALERYRELSVAWERLRQEWLTIVNRDVAAVNAAMAGLRLPAIQLPPPPPIP